MKVVRVLGRSAAAGVLVLLSAAVLSAPSFAAELGPLTISPKAGDIYSTLSMQTQGACPKGSNAVVARIYGPGFPLRGQNVTAVAPGNMSLKHGFTVLSEFTMKDLAAIPYPPVVYNGNYTISVTCLDATGPTYGQYVGQIVFAADGTFTTKSGGPLPATPKPGIKVSSPAPAASPAKTAKPSPAATPIASASPSMQPDASAAPSATPAALNNASGTSSGSAMNPLLPALGGLLVGALVVAAIFLIRGRGKSKTT